MDDSCAVCAEPLEWVAYGPCGHREVCSTCVARLRFILDDRRCCICKTDCNVVFVTKAMGDYTKMIDFLTLPSELRDGKVGRYWYHEDMQAFFDDIDQYKMIKAMCKLSCSLCDKADEQPDANQRRRRFRNIDQLKGHLYHQHKLHMCSLCLEGRKVFICEQKLYTRAQLDRHIRTGDSEVDGTESERGGFTGHPRCEFCRTPFYGDNELYTHMTTEHYTCHICQRQNPGHYEYYRNYDDLETHFGQAHFLCEDEACLAKKFIVFQSEAEFKRHNALEHGGHMSRSKRNAALQIPTSFRYRSGNDAGASRGRGRGSFRRESSPDNQLTQAIHASFETAGTDGRAPRASSLAEVSDVAEESYADPLIQPFESLATTSDSELPSRYREALSQNSRNTLEESYFPPLSTTASGSSQQRTQIESNGSTQNTMAARLRRKNNIKVLNTSQAWPTTSRQPVALSSIPVQPQPVVMNTSRASASSSGAVTPAATNDPLPSIRANGPPVSSSSYASSVLTRPKSNHGLEFGASSTSRVHRSSSASNLAGNVSFNPVSDFPPVSEMKSNPPPPSSSTPLKVDDVQTANKSLIEMIRSSLDDDEDKYANFKYISQEYRQGSVDTWSYFQYVKQFGLSHLILDLARLCPDPQKQKELLEMHNASLRGNKSEETFWGNSKQSASSSKAKEKVWNEKKSTPKDTLADNIIDMVRKLQSEMKPVQGEVEVLKKDGYRTSKGKSMISIEEKPIVILEPVVTLKEPPPANSDAGDEGGNKKGKKKTSKFHRNRLGDDYAGSSLDAGSSTADESADLKGGMGQSSLSGLPVRGVWKNGGGQKLFTAASRK